MKMSMKNSMQHSRREERQIYALMYFKRVKSQGTEKINFYTNTHTCTHTSCNKIFNGLVNILTGDSGWGVGARGNARMEHCIQSVRAFPADQHY